MKKLILIVSIILFSAVQSNAQTTRMSSATDAGPILRFYPNPATSSNVKFDFQRGFDRGYSIQIYSLLGKKMFESNNIVQSNSVNLSDYIRGVYVYQLRDRSGRVVESGKFQVSR